MLQNEQLGQLSFKQLIGQSQDRQHTQDAFSQICQAYVKVDACLEQCEKSSDSSARVRQTYAGIRFICVDHKKG
uniref:Apple domain-containing protein n=1 Tax=Angiostrongylus cantonensis TaxID=6313 RepID=A0A0K0D4U3_ANGCA